MPEYWQAMNDAQTLARANEILADEKRLNAAREMAKNLADEELQHVTAMLQVAGKSNTTVEGMRIVGQRMM